MEAAMSAGKDANVRGGGGSMLIPTVIMAVLAAVLLYIGYARGEGQHVEGLRAGWSMTIRILPLFACAMIAAGMVQTLVPSDLVARWVGPESGLRGILIGTAAGAVTPGGPFVSFPIAAGFYKAGASVGTTVAFITSWSLIALTRMPLQVGLLGWKLTAVQLASSFFFPPVAGAVAQYVVSKL